MTMLLPTPVDRAALRGFWLFVSLAVGLTAGLALPLFGISGTGPRLGVAFAATGASAMPGMLWPYSVWPVYRAWNRVAREIAVQAIRYVTAVCFWTVARALGRTATLRQFEMSSDEPSMWRLRATQPPGTYASLYHDDSSVPGNHWTRPVRTWMRSSGHVQARALLPFLWLIHALDPGKPKPAAEDHHIYTLY